MAARHYTVSEFCHLRAIDLTRGQKVRAGLLAGAAGSDSGEMPVLRAQAADCGVKNPRQPVLAHRLRHIRKAVETILAE